MKVLERATTTPNGSPTRSQRSKNAPRMLIALAIAIAVIVAAGLIVRARLGSKTTYVTAAIVRKNLVQVVTATGTVNPQDTILVGTQVSGTISELGADFNSVVKAGQVLARIDPTSLHAQLDQAQASESQSHSVASAGAAAATSAARNVVVAQKNAAAAREGYASAQAQVGKAKAAFDLASLTLARDKLLFGQGFVSQAQVDSDTSNAAAARASYAAAKIAVDQAKAQVDAQVEAAGASLAQAQSAAASANASGAAIRVQHAAVTQARYNYRNSVIKSPVAGTVISRNISVGQTVAASFQTPTLFTLARDLSKMEVDVAVGEPDIGNVRAGDVADFTVLAYPNRTFRGTVYQVRRNPTTINNVVTYDTVVYVRNDDGALSPGMTANASIHVAKIANALVVPIAALQYAPATAPRRTGVTTASVATSPWGLTEAAVTRTIIAGRNGSIYLMRQGAVERIPVRILLVSGTEAAIEPRSGNVAAEEPVVTADSTQIASAAAQARSPLTQAAVPRGGPR